MAQDQQAKKVVMIIAQNNFRDEELKEPKAVMEGRGIKVVVASQSLNEARGTLGYRIKPDILVASIREKDYDALILVGGSGSNVYWDDPVVHKIAQSFSSKGKVIGAICIAPVTLAKAGILNNKKATVFPSEIGHLKKGGAIYSGNPVEADGNIVTANGPAVAAEFGKTIADLLK